MCDIGSTALPIQPEFDYLPLTMAAHPDHAHPTDAHPVTPSLAQRIRTLEHRNLDQRIQTLENRVAGIDARFAYLENRFNGILARLTEAYDALSDRLTVMACDPVIPSEAASPDNES